MNFNKLTASDKRIAIAKDILKQLRLSARGSSNFTPVRGSYIYLPNKMYEVSPTIAQSNCRVCAIGSVFVSATKLRGKLTLGDSNYHTVSREYFGDKQAEAIENYFEAYSRYTLNLEPKEALKRIARNIVRNGGKFLVSQESWK